MNTPPRRQAELGDAARSQRALEDAKARRCAPARARCPLLTPPPLAKASREREAERWEARERQLLGEREQMQRDLTLTQAPDLHAPPRISAHLADAAAAPPALPNSAGARL